MISISPRKICRTGDDRPVDSLWDYVLRMTGRHQATACGVAVLVAALNLVPIELQRRMIDNAIAQSKFELLLSLAAVYAAVILTHKVLKWLLVLYQGWLSESAIFYTRHHLLGLYRTRITRKGARPGEAVSIINAEVDKLGGFVGAGPSQAAVNLAMLLGVLGYMLMVEPRIAVLAILLLVPQVLLVPLIQRQLNQLIEDRVALVRALGEEVAAQTGDDGEQSDRRLYGIYVNRMRFLFWKNLMKGLLNLLNQLAPLGVLLWAGWLVIDGKTTVGLVVAFISGFERMSGPVRELLSLYRTAQQAAVQHEMIATWIRPRISTEN